MKITRTEPSPNAAQKEPLVKPAECARHLGICTPHLAKLADVGKVPFYPLSSGGRKYRRYRISEVELAIRQEVAS